MRLHCNDCGKSVSNEVHSQTLVRGWISCPECVQKPEITEQFLSDKAKLFVYAIMPSGIEPTRSDFHAAKEFLRSLFEEIHGEK